MTETCRKCGKKFELEYKAFPGSCTDSDSYNCPYCDEEYRYKASGYYTVKKINNDEK